MGWLAAGLGLVAVTALGALAWIWDALIRMQRQL